jgi:hypothetical protein
MPQRGQALRAGWSAVAPGDNPAAAIAGQTRAKLATG